MPAGGLCRPGAKIGSRHRQFRRDVPVSAKSAAPSNRPKCLALPNQSRTVGFIHGVDRSVERTCIGFYEVLTFPIPNHPPLDYGPIMRPANPVYPDSYKPNAVMSSSYSPDASLGFSGGDVAPIIPGSRFRIFDN